MIRRRFLTSLAACAALSRRASGANKLNPADWIFLDNGQLKLGVKKTSGAGIAWLSASGSTENLLDH